VSWATPATQLASGLDAGVKVYRKSMRIGELAERAGTSARTLRYYEQQGLLDTRRDASGYRDFDEVDLRLVREIRSLLEIGFNLEEARPFVECLRAGNASGGMCPDSIAVLQRKLADLDGCIARLTEARDRVSQELTTAVEQTCTHRR